ncbi:MAG: hypothetical protein M1818_005023 [Claussenomyces sp. TS43310]|nr:MAG: hypothetical protein M1818_005023 [Claussenomyces sp. TS43310]
MSSSVTQARRRVLCLGHPAYVGQEFLKDFGSKYDVEILQSANREEVQRDLPVKIASTGPFDAMVIRMGTHPYEPFDEDLLGALVPGCQVIVSASAGYNEFDVDWMTQNNLYFCNTRNAVSEPTADMAMFLILAVLKDSTNAEKSTRTGNWRAKFVPTRDPSGLNLGIIGLGAIGKHLARKANAFNMKIHYYNRTRLSPDVEKQFGATYCENLEELLSLSDVVSVNCPLNAHTTGLISSAEFAAMKDGAYFVNTARGPIVDEVALIEALESGKICRAGLDVFDAEPSINEYFQKSDHCIVQPHLGGLTDAAFRRAEVECFENIRSFFETGRPVASVNEVSVEIKL